MQPTEIEGLKCPKCGGTQLICSNRGYSLLGGIVGALLTMFAYIIYWIITTGYGDLSETAQTLLIAFSGKWSFLAAFLLGLLWGLVGSKKLVYQCAACGKRFEKDDVNLNKKDTFKGVLIFTIIMLFLLGLVYIFVQPQ